MAGPLDRTFDLSGVPLALGGLSVELGAALDGAWGAFRAPARAPWLRVRVLETAGAPTAGLPLAATLVDDGPTPCFATPEGRIVLDGAGGAELTLARVPVALGLHAVINLVLAAVAVVGPARGTLVVHGAGIVVDGSGFALVGPAGSGKSTWVGLAGAAHAPISDDLVGIATAGARVEILALPFRRWPSPAAGPGRWPLGALLVPAHGAAHRLEPVELAVARSALVANLPHLAAAARTGAAVTAAIDRVLADVPVRRLVFARDPGFIDLLRPLAAR